MKNSILYFLAIYGCFSLLSCGGETQPAILDVAFANAIRAKCPDCIDAKNRLTAAAAKLKQLDVSNQPIASLEGFNFPELEIFICNSTAVRSLPKFSSKLEQLHCSATALTELSNLDYPNLIYLDCANNQLTNLPNLNLPKLRVLKCSQNKISSLPTLNCPELESLDINKNALTTLPDLKLPKLNFLSCSDNQINSIPSLNLPMLETFWCNNNPIQNLPALPASLKKLYIDGTNIKCVPAGTTADINMGVTFPFCPQ